MISFFYLQRSRLQAEQELEDGGQSRLDETSEHRTAGIGDHRLKKKHNLSFQILLILHTMIFLE